MLTRRNLFIAGAAAGGSLLIPAGNAVLAGTVRGADSGVRPATGHVHGSTGAGPATAPGTAPMVDPFTVRMPIPPVLAPVRSHGATHYYHIPIRPANVEIFPGSRTSVLSYGGGFVGPTIRVRRGRTAKVRFVNELGMPANVHLHGGHVSPDNDGHPMDLIEPGHSRVYEYPNQQHATTLWYHDHSHHMEAEHVYRGLHGFYLIEDGAERRLRLPSGAYDVPIMLREARFDEQAQLHFDPFDFERPTVLVNGRPQPYFPVAARRYRFRLLNASAHGSYTLSLDGAKMVQIGSDGGLLTEPVELAELVLGPAERADIVIDFSRLRPGQQAMLANAAGPVLRFDVIRRARDDSRVPDRLNWLAPLPRASRHRTVTFSTDFENIRSLINGKEYDPERIDFRVKHGTSEIWTIENVDTDFGGVDHTFHMHLVQFRVLERNGAPPAPSEAGLKDTVLLRPGERVRIMAHFRGQLGRYVYHCHMLEHSAFGMMAQFEVVR
ncbi:multicopper oxidase family protein [Micromonospora sp. LOL_014]|uniref:multicopper oxidase family protein n=1 Tax=Micromonospora sp. LOL_014 TaxID=3345415 RepID=UPI003A85B1F6